MLGYAVQHIHVDWYPTLVNRRKYFRTNVRRFPILCLLLMYIADLLPQSSCSIDFTCVLCAHKSARGCDSNDSRKD